MVSWRLEHEWLIHSSDATAPEGRNWWGFAHSEMGLPHRIWGSDQLKLCVIPLPNSKIGHCRSNSAGITQVQLWECSWHKVQAFPNGPQIAHICLHGQTHQSQQMHPPRTFPAQQKTMRRTGTNAVTWQWRAKVCISWLWEHCGSSFDMDFSRICSRVINVVH